MHLKFLFAIPLAVLICFAAAMTAPLFPSTHVNGTGSQNIVEAAAPAANATAGQAQLDRGKYLAHSVAMCVVCHSPKDEQGLPIASQAFQGGAIPAKPTYAGMATWAERAPALGPMAGGAGEDVIELLKTGIWRPSGQQPRNPMPQFRFSDEDARAVVAYLSTQ
jgi:mono/diheme cytochrome c family protein